MKCSKCSGAGYIYNNLVGYAEDCSVCHGKGEVLTNEEWLHTMNTVQLADKLTDFSFWLVPTIPTEDKREQIRKKIELWLKEIHE